MSRSWTSFASARRSGQAWPRNTSYACVLATTAPRTGSRSRACCGVSGTVDVLGWPGRVGDATSPRPGCSWTGSRLYAQARSVPDTTGTTVVPSSHTPCRVRETGHTAAERWRRKGHCAVGCAVDATGVRRHYWRLSIRLNSRTRYGDGKRPATDPGDVPHGGDPAGHRPVIGMS
jgi:hypothetical protein